MPRKAKKLLQRGEDSLSVDATVWANTLLLASNWGWKPDRPTHSFMAKDFEVTDKEATALAQTIDRIWNSLGDDPYALKINPKVNLSLLMDIGAFCLGHALDQMRTHLGDKEWENLLDIQKRSGEKYRYSPAHLGRDEMSCMYLGQLLALMIHGSAWPFFKHLFRDKRQLEDMMASITPVRADRAHFSKVPEKELNRCKIACDDLLVILGN